MSSLTPDHLPLREELRGQHAYGAPQLSVTNQLNTNENPYAPSQAIIDQLTTDIARQAATLNRYPDRDAVQLRADLAEYFTNQTGVQVSQDNVWAANGSNEVLQQLLQTFAGPGRTALGFTPSYSMHPILAAGNYTEFIEIPRDAQDGFAIPMQQAVEAIHEYTPDVIFITTPNNPTGGSTPLEDIETILQVAPGIVIVDEAYAEFSSLPSSAELIQKYPDKLVVSRTMSKAFDFAGGRLGYFVADPAFVEAVQLVRLPYHLSTLSQTAARVALQHSGDTLETVHMLIEQRQRIVEALEAMGYTVIPSDSNFVFFGKFSDSHAAWEEFLDRDVLIRDVGVPGFLRVTVGTPQENDAFLTAAEVVNKFQG